jgi:hypothetical protein
VFFLSDSLGWAYVAAHPETGGFFSYNGNDGWVNAARTSPAAKITVCRVNNCSGIRVIGCQNGMKGDVS